MTIMETILWTTGMWKLVYFTSIFQRLRCLISVEQISLHYFPSWQNLMVSFMLIRGNLVLVVWPMRSYSILLYFTFCHPTNRPNAPSKPNFPNMPYFPLTSCLYKCYCFYLKCHPLFPFLSKFIFIFPI